MVAMVTAAILDFDLGLINKITVEIVKKGGKVTLRCIDIDKSTNICKKNRFHGNNYLKIKI